MLTFLKYCFSRIKVPVETIPVEHMVNALKMHKTICVGVKRATLVRHVQKVTCCSKDDKIYSLLFKHIIKYDK